MRRIALRVGDIQFLFLKDLPQDLAGQEYEEVLQKKGYSKIGPFEPKFEGGRQQKFGC